LVYPSGTGLPRLSWKKGLRIPSGKGAIMEDFLSIEKHCERLLSNVVRCTFAGWHCGAMASVSI